MNGCLGFSLLAITNAQLYWVPLSSTLGHHLVNSDRTWDKVARFTNEDGFTIPGRGREYYRCYFLYHGKEYTILDQNSCEMLAVNKSIPYATVSYVPKNTSLYGVPAGAVIGGFTADHFPLYIVELGVMGHLDVRNNYAECLYHGNIPTTATTWNYLVLEYKTRVVAFRYLFGYKVLDRIRGGGEFTEGNDLIDNQDNTCVPVMTQSGEKLQAVFDFPSANISHEMSMKIVVKNTTDCAALMWTWYTESTCTAGYYQECQKTALWQTGLQAACLVTCLCPSKCDYLYLKFEPKRQDLKTGIQLCEVTLTNYGPVEPGLIK